jgi:hypothetical protein
VGESRSTPTLVMIRPNFTSTSIIGGLESFSGKCDYLGGAPTYSSSLTDLAKFKDSDGNYNFL